jgi:hypothetical protein
MNQSEDISNLENSLIKLFYTRYKLNKVLIGGNKVLSNNLSGGDKEIKLIKKILDKKIKNKLNRVIELYGGDPYAKLKDTIANFSDNAFGKINTIINEVIKSEVPALTKNVMDKIQVAIKEIIKGLPLKDIISDSMSGASSQATSAAINTLTFGLLSPKETFKKTGEKIIEQNKQEKTKEQKEENTKNMVINALSPKKTEPPSTTTKPAEKKKNIFGF